jgi:hypothetical protein
MKRRRRGKLENYRGRRSKDEGYNRGSIYKRYIGRKNGKMQ